MNARKHRECKQAKETDRLEPKGQQSGSESVAYADANSELPVYRADLNHPVDVTEHENAANLVRTSHPGRPHRKAGQGAQQWDDRISQRQR